MIKQKSKPEKMHVQERLIVHWQRQKQHRMRQRTKHAK